MMSITKIKAVDGAVWLVLMLIPTIACGEQLVYNPSCIKTDINIPLGKSVVLKGLPTPGNEAFIWDDDNKKIVKVGQVSCSN
jgi:hypothetical protein